MTVVESVPSAKMSDVTVSHVLGEIVWLISQSRNHIDTKISELNWLVMPAVLNKNFHIFRSERIPIGVAIWASTDQQGEEKIISGQFKQGLASEADWASGDRLWLIELIAPFSNAENKHAEMMFADLISGVFYQKPFKMMKVDPVTGVSSPAAIDADAGKRLVDYVQHALGDAA